MKEIVETLYSALYQRNTAVTYKEKIIVTSISYLFFVGLIIVLFIAI